MTPTVTYETLDSTNAEARRRAALGDRGPLWIRARQQTAGIGRSGRRWLSPPGNIAATLLFEPACPAHRLPQLALLAGVAAAEAISAELEHLAAGARPPQTILKWPNDVLIDGAKCAGILVESVSQGNSVTAMIGFGINVATAPEVDGRRTTALARHAADADADRLMTRLAAAVDRWRAMWEGPEGFDPIREGWLARSFPTGEPITVRIGEQLLAGHFAGIDPDGALVMLTAEGRRRLTHGDVSVSER